MGDKMSKIVMEFREYPSGKRIALKDFTSFDVEWSILACRRLLLKLEDIKDEL